MSLLLCHALDRTRATSIDITTTYALWSGLYLVVCTFDMRKHAGCEHLVQVHLDWLYSKATEQSRTRRSISSLFLPYLGLNTSNVDRFSYLCRGVAVCTARYIFERICEHAAVLVGQHERVLLRADLMMSKMSEISVSHDTWFCRAHVRAIWRCSRKKGKCDL